MSQEGKRSKIPEQAELRRQAEERLEKGGKARPSAIDVDQTRVAHELEVFRTELEMQNDELRSTRADLEAGLAQYTELFDFAPIGYATLDKLDVIQAINQAGTRLLGENRAALLGKPFRALVVPEQQPFFGALLDKARHSQMTERADLMIRHPRRKQLVHVRVSISVVTPSRQRTLLAFEDITEQRHREEQLAATEKALREANLRTQEFLATLSHELRNPLAPIRNSLFLLERAPPGSPAAEKAKTVIARQAAHLTRLVDDLLDMTRIVRGKVQLRRERLELGELLRTAVEDQRLDFEMQSITLTYCSDPEPFWVDVDSARIVQIVANLLGNAEKFTPRGGRVEVTLQRAGSNVALDVRDTGIGMTPEVI